MPSVSKHKWSDAELYVVYSICKLKENDDYERIRILQLIFPDYSIIDIERIVDKYNSMFTNRTWCCCIN